MEIVGIASVAAITVIAYLIGEVVKATGLDNNGSPLSAGSAAARWESWA